MADTETRSDWPGERTPSHRDVVSANERPDPSLLSSFKTALLSSDDAMGTEVLLHTKLERDIQSSHRYTYPLALLSSFPNLPPAEHIDVLCRNFIQGCTKHLFFDRFPPSAFSRDLVAPMRFGLACLASVSTGAGVQEAEALFSAGASLWLAMIEMDNSLARSGDMLLAAVLLIPCGILGTTEVLRKRATLIIPASLTIARRMHLQSPGLTEGTMRQRVLSYSPMLWSIWLWDVLQAIHADLPLQFYTTEVLSPMPSSALTFQTVYRELVDDLTSGNEAILSTLEGNRTTRDDAFLLLLGILSDAVTVRRSVGSNANVINPAPQASVKHNYFSPFAAHTELERIHSQLSVALDRWHALFSASMSPDIMALFQYCRLYLSCPTMPDIQRAAKSPDAETCRHALLCTFAEREISDESADISWSLLDIVAAWPKVQDSLCSAWMPVVVFQAALVVWGKITLSRREPRILSGHTSIRALTAFKVELETMHWPCCSPMAETLHKLMST